MRSRRTTELLLLLAAAPPVLLVFALVDTALSRSFTWMSLAVPGALLAAFVVAHIAVRRFAKGADPGLLPAAFVLSGLGLAFVTRLDAELAASQVTWLFIGVAALVATLAFVPSLEELARYKYTIMIAGIVLLVLPAIIGKEINGAKLWIRFGGVGFQPGEIAKVCIVIFLAAYLSENREMLSVSTRRILGMRLPEPRTLGPLLLMWVVSLFVLVAERDLGSSLLLFGTFLVMLYTATGRGSYVAVGLTLFGGGAYAAFRMFDHVQTRVAIWLDPFADASGRGYQLVQSLFAFAAGGLTGTGLGQGLPTRIPFVATDFIFSAIGEELGLLGAVAVILCFLVFSVRGLATAARARSDMAAFTAVGVVAAVALQAFVIIGGVTRLIPLTGVTLPFVSYGGSSLVSTFILLGLLLHAGDEGTGLETEMQTTSTDLGVLGRFALGRRLMRVSITVVALLVALVANLSWIQVVQARNLQNNAHNTRGLAEQARQDRGSILTRDGVVLAESVPDGRTTYRRTYPAGALAAHTVGYYSVRYGRSGIESAANDALAGQRVYNSWSDVIAAATGQAVEGDDVVLTIDSRVQKAAEKTLGKRRGAVVVIDPRTGAVLASASTPDYDPADVEKRWEKLSTAESAPLLDRARQSLRAPGSTFKVVTLTGALSAGTATPESVYSGKSPMEIGNAPVTNFEGGSYGSVDLATATQRSINTVFGQVAVAMGPDKLVSQANAFGFGKSPGYELPVKKSLMPSPSEMTTWETAWAGIGQPVGEHESPAGPQATVMQMAQVASGIANSGVVMRPYVVGEIKADSAKSGSKTLPRPQGLATTPATAGVVKGIMIDVVAKGSGARARIPGVQVAGKTGTAETGKSRTTDAWFIAFAPAENPVVAMAIMIEQGGVGGRVAAPAAKPVLEAALEAQGISH
ncbi:MAG TPA: FtsW/RodA/SpoVE family cell cycle protein [Coriobacteriia bacterium]|nr:FtsW/RodA/SpoVE family cell cycle protein [Coriobacteriia bacterium]